MHTVFIRVFQPHRFPARAGSLRRVDNAARRSAELQAIVDRIVARDVPGSQDAIRRHIRSVGDLAVDYLDAAPEAARDG